MSDPERDGRVLLPVSEGGRARADEWALVLASQNIPVRLLRTPDGWALELGSADLAAAESALASNECERREADRDRSAAKQAKESFVPRGPRWAGLPIGLAYLAFFVYSGERTNGGSLFVAGSAISDRILAGEWWRCVTALCLHANLGHVLGNVLANLFFMGIVCRLLGLGCGFALIFAAGALGNALNAFAQPLDHSSVGASTAVFGAIGLLCGLAMVRQYRSNLRGKRAWVPIGAGLALLAMLGTSGERVDLGAHYFGLLVGVVLGATVALCLKQAPSSRLQWLFGTTAITSILVCWALALR